MGKPSPDVIIGIMSISTLFDNAPKIAATLAVIWYIGKAIKFLKDRYWNVPKS